MPHTTHDTTMPELLQAVDTAFDLLAGRLTQLKVTDQQVGEHLELFDLQAGDLVVTDRANGLVRAWPLCKSLKPT